MSTRKYLAHALCAASLLAMSSHAFAAQFVVVEARGVNYSPGASIDSTKPLALKEGQHLTLISPAGATIKLDGPYNQAPDAGQGHGVDISTKLSALVAGGQRFGEVGTTRGTAPVKLPSPWLLDVSRSGTVCLLDNGGEPVLWHPASSANAKVAIMPDDRSWRADLIWPSKSDRLALGTGVPLHGGTTYFVTMNGDQSAVSIDSVPASLSSDQMRAAWMANKGCEAQAEAMLRSAK
jgi:hypothetical protein